MNETEEQRAERDSASRKPCEKCGSLHPNPECKTCVEAQIAREIARYGIERDDD